MQIEMQDIHKYYGSIKANNGVSLKVTPGRIHGILGENGAGKSTLMKILAGFSLRTHGSILIDGIPVHYANPAQAVKRGIGMLYQDPLDFPYLTVLDNYMLGQSAGFLYKKRHFRRNFQRIADSLQFPLHADSWVRTLTVGERQQLELLRLLAMGIQTLILDEPTTGISNTQKEILFKALRKLSEQGKNIILVSHKLDDVGMLCDTVTVLRHGIVSGNMEGPFDTHKLLEMMFGRPPSQLSRSFEAPGMKVLEMRGVFAAGTRAELKDCNVVIRQGEVIGLAGLEGSGQGEFLRIAAGLRQASKGSVALMDREMGHLDYHHFQRKGVTFIPASRLEEGLISGLSIVEHFMLQKYHPLFLMKRSEAAKLAKERISRFNVIGAPESRVEALSGGNQQRLLLSFLPPSPVLLLLENPTRGLDVESVHWVWKQLHGYSHNKTSIVFSSSELDEILMVSDRVLVFFNGRIVKDVTSHMTDLYEVGRAIAGIV